MAANQYYDHRFSFSSTPRPEDNHESPRPYYNQTPQPNNGIPLQTYESSRPSPAPSYHSQPGTPHLGTPAINEPPHTYNEDFNDHVYSTPNAGLAPSTSYNPAGGSTPSFQDTTPLTAHAASPSRFSKYANRPNANTVDDDYDCVVDRRRGRLRDDQGRPWVVKFRNKPIAVVTYLLTLIQIIVFIVEIVKNAQLTGSPIEIHPSFNPMIGPSPYVLINMGARYVPCMHNVEGIQDRTSPISWPCPNTTSNSVAECTLSDLCGFSGVPNPEYHGDGDQKPEPDQWFRFIVPIFLHAGIIHIAFNMLLQLTLGREMEVLIGHLRYFLVYFASGIFGFSLGGNYAATGIASTGASGALFGIVALTLLDLLYNWQSRPKHWWDLFWIMLDIVVSFVLGLLPGLDNFSHIGGFFMGLVLGICILRSPAALRERIGDSEITEEYSPMIDGFKTQSGATKFVKSPVGFFKGRKGAWWAWWLARAASLAFVFIVFILLLNNFYTYRKTCSWCKYLSCINVNNWCSLGNLDFTTTNTTDNSTSKRSVFDSWDGMAKLYMDEDYAAI